MTPRIYVLTLRVERDPATRRLDPAVQRKAVVPRIERALPPGWRLVASRVSSRLVPTPEREAQRAESREASQVQVRVQRQRSRCVRAGISSAFPLDFALWLLKVLRAEGLAGRVDVRMARGHSGRAWSTGHLQIGAGNFGGRMGDPSSGYVRVGRYLQRKGCNPSYVPREREVALHEVAHVVTGRRWGWGHKHDRVFCRTLVRLFRRWAPGAMRSKETPEQVAASLAAERAVMDPADRAIVDAQVAAEPPTGREG